MSADSDSISNQAFYSYSHPLQKRRFILALVFSALLFPLIALGLIAGTVALIVPLFALLVWIGARVLFAHYVGNTVLVSEVNYPRINAIAEDLKRRMGYPKRVYIFVLEMSSFNAFLSRLFFRRAIFLTSEILEQGVTDGEARWLVGRFIGYLRARRQTGALGMIIRAAQKLLVFNLFILPYERAMVYTGDRLALAALGGDVSTATSAMQKLFVGRQLGYSLNPEGILDQQRQLKGTFFGFLARVSTGFPHLTARYVSLIEFAKAFFPEQFGKFAAANPGIPADLSPMVSGPPSDRGRPAKSGMAPGWVVVTSITIALLGVTLLGWRSATSTLAGVQSPISETEAAQPTLAQADSPALAPVANSNAPAHAHYNAKGELEADPGCHWVSNSPSDFRVACNQTPVSEETTQQQPSTGVPEHAHLTAAGQLETDPGCHWVSNDPKDFRVACD
jgi:hypothetical protein